MCFKIKLKEKKRKEKKSLTVIIIEYNCKVNAQKVIKCNQLHYFNKVIEIVALIIVVVVVVVVVVIIIILNWVTCNL